MKQIPIFTKLYQIICKDTGSENESAKLIIAVRMLTLTMLLYSFVDDIISAFTPGIQDSVFATLSLVFYLAVFVCSYYCKPYTAYCILNAYILLWVFLSMVFFGWNIGVQHFINTLLVFCFFARYGHMAGKLFYTLLLFSLRLYLYYYCRSHTPIIMIGAEINDALQIVNTFFVFLSLITVCYYFGRDSKSVEGKLVEYNEQLMEQASIDPLTGLHNRRSTMKYLDRVIASAEHQISICICDIDFFKRVNDTYGHDIGDEVLKGISKAFQKELSENCFLSRWGGEEFLLIFPACNGDEALPVLESLRHSIKKLSFHGGSEEFRVTLTYGLVEHDYHSDLTTTLKEADEKLYYGKEHGRDQIVY